MILNQEILANHQSNYTNIKADNGKIFKNVAYVAMRQLIDLKV